MTALEGPVAVAAVAVEVIAIKTLTPEAAATASATKSGINSLVLLNSRAARHRSSTTLVICRARVPEPKEEVPLRHLGGQHPVNHGTKYQCAHRAVPTAQAGAGLDSHDAMPTTVEYRKCRICYCARNYALQGYTVCWFYQCEYLLYHPPPILPANCTTRSVSLGLFLPTSLTTSL